MSHEEGLEEINKQRIALGLKPLTDDKAQEDTPEKRAEKNYAKQREKEVQEREEKRIQDRIAKVRNKRELNTKLKGRTLGDADNDVDNTKAWLKKSKKKGKELNAKSEEIGSRNNAALDVYDERDLEGLKVSHDFTEMDEGEARILTLKDSRILDNEEDELQNVEIAEAERRKKDQELKIKRRDYTGYDDEEFEPGKVGIRRGVLSKYDTVIDGDKTTEFRLGGSMKAPNQKIVDQDEVTVVSVNKSLLSVDYAKNIEISDYLQEGDVGFKKPKKKKRHNNKRVIESSMDDAPGTADGDEKMQVDEKPIIPEARNLDVNFVDDDDLQAALARSRKAKLRKPQKLSPEEVAKKISEQRAQSMNIDDDQTAANDEDGLTFDDTSEFVRSITYDPSAVKKEPEESPVTRRTSPPTVNRDAGMGGTDVALAELEAGEVTVKEEDYDDEMLDAIEDVISAAEAHERETGVKLEEGDLEIGTSGEKTHSSGLAATLNILRQQGILTTPTAASAEREKIQLQRDVWLAEQRRKVEQRELERQKARGGNKDQSQREYENRLRDQQEARANLELFKNYKPDVNIVYHDEFGRELTPKEAWKALSHKFHGKGSGRMKTEKRLKKIAEERKQAAMASGDTPLSMNQAFQKRQEKAGQAHFVLSVGNRGAVPQAVEFLDVQPLSKGKTEKTKKKKEAKAAQQQNSELSSNGFITLPVGPQHIGGDGVTPTGSSPSTPANASPAPRPGFARISSTIVESKDSGSGSGTPLSNGPDGRTKVAFGFGSKRKAGNEHEDSPPPKRR